MNQYLVASNPMPNLESSQLLRFSVFATLYAAQGLPYGLFVIGVPAWLAGQGFSAGDIGSFIALVALPWSFKLVAGPLMDRFGFVAMGRRRPWVIGAQVGILVGMFGLLFLPNPAENLMALAWTGFFINAFCALQDVAVDGMAIDVLPVNERARANAFMFGGQVVGISAASAGGTYALSEFGLTAAAVIMIISVSLILLVAVLIRERPGEKLLPWSAGQASDRALDNQTSGFKSIFGNLIGTLILPMSLLLVACEFLNRASGGIVIAIAPVFTVQELGWLDTEYANWQAAAGIAAAVFGVIVAPWVDRRGASLALVLAIGFKVIVLTAVAIFTSLWSVDGFFSAVIVLINLATQVVTVAIIALFMGICSQRIAATQFAVYMASANLALAAGSALIAPLDSLMSYSGIFLVAAGFNALFLLLWPLFDMEKHQVHLTAYERSQDVGD